MRLLRRITIIASVAVTGLALSAGAAGASYHENLIKEVHEVGANGDYVVLQAYSPGQNLLATKRVNTYDGGGGFLSSVVLNNVPNGANQATVLVGDDTVPGADATDPGFNVVNTGGTVCFSEGGAAPPFTGIDCVAYTGNVLPTAHPPVPPASPYGTPLQLNAPNFDGLSLVRSIGRDCPTLLEKADDTDNSAADFSVSATTSPRNNAAPITETGCRDTVNCARATRIGTDGPDVIRGTKKKDVIDGLGGNDTITGINGKDVICGGFGDDTIKGGNAKDRLFGGGGNDNLRGGNGKDRMDGGDGTDTCNGGRGKDKAVNCELGADAKKGKKGKKK